MALQSITATFQVHIPVDKVINLIEGNMNANSEYKCKVYFEEFDGKENTFVIWADEREAFYQIGMTAALIIQKYSQ